MSRVRLASNCCKRLQRERRRVQGRSQGCRNRLAPRAGDSRRSESSPHHRDLGIQPVVVSRCAQFFAHSFSCNALHKHLHCGEIVLCSERIFIADGFAFYSSRPRTAGDPCAVPSFPQGRIFTQILQNRNEKRTEQSIEFNRKVFRKRQSCAPCKCLRLCRSRGVLPVCERERDRSFHWNPCPSPLESADQARSLEYANRRLQVARLLGRLANEMELFNNKSAVCLAGLQVDLGNQVGAVWIMGENRLRTQCL